MLKTLADHLALGVVVALCLVPRLASADTEDQLDLIRSVGQQGAGHRAAVLAAAQLSRGSLDNLLPVLRAMDGSSPLVENWLRGVGEALVQNAEGRGERVPLADLEQFLAETQHNPRARRFAYELILARDPSAEKRLVAGWLDDPSLELRREAVALLLAEAKAAGEAGRREDAVARFQLAFRAARDEDQIKQAVEQLRGLDQKVDVARHMGFVVQWHLIGPFDNVGKKGFEVAYPPEKQVDLTKAYPGKEGDVRWSPCRTEDDYGLVDLNMVLGKYKGAIAYAFAEFDAVQERDVELRLGCINGNKVWLNGKLLTSNHVYHANMFVDQYVGRGRLREGRNEILIKVAQNEQTENWAQDWKFQLRVCDSIGTAVLARDRLEERAAARRDSPRR